MGIRILCIGDIHLGRRPTRLPNALGEGEKDYAPGAALARAVDLAVAEEVSAVLFAGDLVEHEDDFFEAYGFLRRELFRLVEAGIPVVAVAGNHDTKVLPELADALPELQLLGRGGAWESTCIAGSGGAALRVLGWSFPSRRVNSSPLLSFPSAWKRRAFADGGAPDLPTLGLLHADLDGRDEGYAPVSGRELRETGDWPWLLGHVHAPGEQLGRGTPAYLGSLIGLDPGEDGPRGPWLGRFEQGRWHFEHRGDAVLRFERIRISCDEAEDVSRLRSLVQAAIEERHRELRDDSPGTGLVGLRILLEGRCAVARDERARLLDKLVGQIVIHDAPVTFVEAGLDRTRPRVRLEELAVSGDPVGLLARRLLVLERDDAEARELVRRHEARLAADPALDGGAELPDARTSLLEAGWRALELLHDGMELKT